MIRLQDWGYVLGVLGLLFAYALPYLFPVLVIAADIANPPPFDILLRPNYLFSIPGIILMIFGISLYFLGRKKKS